MASAMPQSYMENGALAPEVNANVSPPDTSSCPLRWGTFRKGAASAAPQSPTRYLLIEERTRMRERFVRAWLQPCHRVIWRMGALAPEVNANVSPPDTFSCPNTLSSHRRIALA